MTFRWSFAGENVTGNTFSLCPNAVHKGKQGISDGKADNSEESEQQQQ